MTDERRSDQEQVRLDKLRTLREQGVDPYPAQSKRTHTAGDVQVHFGQLAAGQEESAEVLLAGRLMAIRRSGKLVFADLHDETGKIQILFSLGDVGAEQFAALDLIDIGDIVNCAGHPLRTRRGELSLRATSFTMLSKCLRPLPEKWHSLRDQETRFRRRYLDLMMNDDVRKQFHQRTLFVRTMRQVLDSAGFLEVETPILEAVPGGADAKPFITHHNTLDINLFLRISLELHLKRLIVGGFEKVYEIGRVFRNEGMSTEHLQEFTLMELYWAYADYHMLMEFIQDMYCRLIEAVNGSLSVRYGEQILDFTPPWPRVDYRELIMSETGIDLDRLTDDRPLTNALEKGGIAPDVKLGRGRLIDQLYKRFCRPKMIQPCFLVNHPLAISPLAKSHPGKPSSVQRFQILFAGSEVGNGYSELNDPLDQAARFEEQAALRERGDDEAQMYDRDFVRALEYAMPPTAGFGVGLDRFLYILFNAPSIREVVFFPTLRPE